MRIGQPGERSAAQVASSQAAKTKDQPAGAAAARETQAAAGGVVVQLGTLASAVSHASRRAPMPDSARVAEILDRVSSGRYQIDFERLAEKMLAEEKPRP